MRKLQREAGKGNVMMQKFSAVLAVAILVAGCKDKDKVYDEKGVVTNAAASSAPSASPANTMTTTPTGLKYQVLKRGTGTVSPKATDTVNVHYHGTLVNGTVFDSSVERGQPISFPLNGVIPGWTEGLQLMKVGDKFKFEIPPNLAYGPASPSPKIPPNSTLVFEVELLGIQ
jgi:FKBP-type peptidyl-prolyl cis-trans isomerase